MIYRLTGCGVGLCEAPAFAVWSVQTDPHAIPGTLGGPTQRLAVYAELLLCQYHDQEWSAAYDTDFWRTANPEPGPPGRLGEL